MSDQYLGEIRMAGFNFAPRGWALCNGQLLAIAQNTALFSLLGTTFGGNGVSTFQLPNLQSRVPIHMGQGVGLSTYVIGQSAGTEDVTLLSAHMPSHNHLISASSTTGTVTSPSGTFAAQINSGTPRAPVVADAFSNTANVTMAPTALSMSGGNQPHSNIQPYLTINFIIALSGIFPSRN